MKGISTDRQAIIAEREELYKAGMTDAEISEKQRVGVQTVRVWRVKRGLPKNPEREDLDDSKKPCLKNVQKKKLEQQPKKTPDIPSEEACANYTPEPVGETPVTDDIAARQEAALQEARAAGMIVSDKPWDGEDDDPYVYDGSMSPEDFERRTELLLTEDKPRPFTVDSLKEALTSIPYDAYKEIVICGVTGRLFTGMSVQLRYDSAGKCIERSVTLEE